MLLARVLAASARQHLEEVGDVGTAAGAAGAAGAAVVAGGADAAGQQPASHSSMQGKLFGVFAGTAEALVPSALAARHCLVQKISFRWLS